MQYLREDPNFSDVTFYALDNFYPVQIIVPEKNYEVYAAYNQIRRRFWAFKLHD